MLAEDVYVCVFHLHMVSSDGLSHVAAYLSGPVNRGYCCVGRGVIFYACGCLVREGHADVLLVASVSAADDQPCTADIPHVL